MACNLALTVAKSLPSPPYDRCGAPKDWLYRHADLTYRLHKDLLPFWTLFVISIVEYAIFAYTYWRGSVHSAALLKTSTHVGAPPGWYIHVHKQRIAFLTGSCSCGIVLATIVISLGIGAKFPRWRDWLRVVSQRILPRGCSAKK